MSVSKGELQQLEEKMKKTVDLLVKEYATMRAGRATPALLEKVFVDYYGTPTPVNQLATISVPEPRLLVVQPWDKNILPQVEKAILKSDLGVNPVSDGNVIRISIPPLTQEKRKELVKVIGRKAEEARVAIRNLRREWNDKVKSSEKKGEISEDEARRKLEDIQKLTDKYIKKIDQVLAAKEKEIMEL
ncbi:MAG: Ribosome-recycling factor [Thermoanaerobacterales bacterium 50_218]|nr:MAG: Ribosome-recycling factor [Thermoanaerobacterales bacterium 50_218]HAA90275.1 ribosome recycling factor [Peptococcaceae bacterium]